MNAPLLPLLLLASLGPQPERLCAAAERFLVEDRRMVVVTERDTVDDWRTRRRLPGCRVTAAGLTAQTLVREAARFYERVRASGWTRTPDPLDAPNEASLRFRRGGADCLFNVYAGGHVLSDAELRVSEAVVPAPGQLRYHVFVMCVDAMDAAPRPASGR